MECYIIIKLALYESTCIYVCVCILYIRYAYPPTSIHMHTLTNAYIFRIKGNKSCVLCAQSCPTLCDPMDCSLPGSSVHGIFQARILEWVAISCFRGSSRFRDWTHVSCVCYIGRQILYHWATWEAPFRHKEYQLTSKWGSLSTRSSIMNLIYPNLNLFWFNLSLDLPYVRNYIFSTKAWYFM